MRIISKILLILQIIIPLFTSAQSVASAINMDAEAISNRDALSKVKKGLPELTSKLEFDSGKNSSGEEILASALSRTGQIISSDNSRDAAKGWLESSAYGHLSGQMQTWLNQYGNSRVQISKNTLSAELLIPLFENSNHLIFSQTRFNKASDDKKVMNLGLGYRHFTDDWMWGVNSFYDRDLTNNNARWGAGLELSGDYVKLSTNGYWRLTDWRQSKLTDFTDYDERPANGFDVRLEGFLPNYPNLGASFEYEKYFGENINLKGTTSLSDLKDNPESYRVGLSYTPVSLFTFKLSKIMGDVNETIGSFEVNYRFGVPLEQQLDTDFVSQMRTLKGSRYNFVDRNNAIVMQYQRQALLRIALPKTLEILATQPATLMAVITQNKYKIDRIEWSAPLLIAKGGTLISSPVYPYVATIRMPFYDKISTVDGNRYDVTAVAVDVNGNRSNTATTNVIVLPAPINEVIPNFAISPNANIVADGEAAGVVTLRVINDNNEEELADVAVDFAIVNDNGQEISGIKLDNIQGATLTRKTDIKGNISFPITSIKAGYYTLNAAINGRELRSGSISFIGDSSNAQIDEASITVEPDSAIANSGEKLTVKVKVIDKNGNIVASKDVTFTEENGTVTTVTTDQDGNAQLPVAGYKPGKSSVNVKVGDSEGVNVDLNFKADMDTAAIVTDTITLLTEDQIKFANGKDIHKVKVAVKDGYGNVVANQKVLFTVDNKATVTQNVITNAEGIAFADVTNETLGDTKIVASVTSAKAGYSSAETRAFFTTTATISNTEDIEVIGEPIVNGEGVTVKVKIVDENGKAVIGEKVTFIDEDGNETISTTDSEGFAHIVIVSPRPGHNDVLVRVGVSEKKVEIDFGIDRNSARIADGAFTILTNGIDKAANGVDAHKVQVIVTDRYGNLVPDYEVSFTATNDLAIPRTVQTDKDGVVTLDLTSTKMGTYNVKASITNKLDQTTGGNGDITFVADKNTATIAKDALTVLTKDETKRANGVDIHKVQVEVKDNYGNAIADQKVMFSADNGANMVQYAITDEKGLAVVNITSLTAGKSNIVATMNNAKGSTSSAEAKVTFIADNDTTAITKDSITVLTKGEEKLANGADSHKIQVDVKDVYGNAIVGQKVSFTASNGASIVQDAITDENGRVIVDVTSLTAGESNIVASIVNAKNVVSSTNASVTFVADNSTMKFTVTADDKAGVVADGKASHSVMVTVTDANNNPIADQVVGVKADNGATLVKVDKTDAAGKLAVTVTNTKAGDSVVTVTVNELAAQSVTVAFIADSSTVQFVDSDMNVTMDNALANGEATNSVTVLVKDEHGNPVPNYEVAFSAAEGAKVANKVASTNSDGIATMTITSTIAGSYDISASITNKSGQTSSGKKPVTFIADSSTMKFTVTADDKTDVVADGKASHSVMVTVTDANNNPIADQVVGVKADNGATLVKVDKTDAAGKLAVTVTNTKAGDSVVTVTVNELAAQSVTVAFIADSSTVQFVDSDINVTMDNALANGEATNSVTVLVKDEHGNPVPNYEVAFSAAEGAKVANKVASTNSDGIATMTITSTIAGSYDISASITNKSGQTSSGKKPVTFVSDSSTMKFTVTADDKAGVVADGKASHSVLVTVTDANNNPIADQVVGVKADNGATLVKVDKTDAAGQLTVTVTNTKAGDSVVTVTVNELAEQSVTVAFIADSSTVQFVDSDMNVTMDNALANGEATNSVTVLVKDEHGNPVPNYEVAFSAAEGAKVANKVASTNSDGIATMTITSTIAGSYDISASITNKSGQTSSGKKPVTFVSDSSTMKFTVTADDKADVVADGKASHSVLVTVTDANNNPIADQVVGVKADNGATLVKVDKTDAAGKLTVTVTNTKAGDSVVTVTVNELAAQSVTVAFIADSSTVQFVDSDMNVTMDNALANGEATNSVTVLVKDEHGNPVPNYEVAFSAAEGAKVANKVASTNSDGIATMTITSTIAGSYDISASITNKSGQTSSGKKPVTFVSDSSTMKFTVTADDKADVVADGKASHSVLVTVTDANNNPIADQVVGVKADNGATLVKLDKTDAAGKLTVTVTNTKAGDSVVTVTVNELAEQSVTVAFIADSSTVQFVDSDINVTMDNALANGEATNSVTVLVKDEHGNPVPNYEVAFSAAEGAKVANKVASTNSDGIATMTITSTIAGSYDISASITNKSGQTSSGKKPVTFVSDSSTMKFTVTADDKAGVVADGKASHSVLVTVTDANNNPIADQVVGVKADNGATLVKVDKTDAAGKLAVTVTNTKSGDSIITVTVGGLAPKTVMVVFIADQDTAAITKNALTVLTKDNKKLANGEDSHQIQVEVKDVNGNGVPEQEVFFTASNGATMVQSGITDKNGRIIVDVTSLTAGESNIVASMTNVKNNVVSSTNGKVSFVADNSTAHIDEGSVKVEPDSAIANSDEEVKVKVKVVDKNGNVVAGEDVTFTDQNGKKTTVKTDEDGNAELVISGDEPGKGKVTVEVGDSKVDADVNFKADMDSATIAKDALIVLTSGETKRANGEDIHKVQVEVKDKYGNVVKGQKVSFTADNGASIIQNATTGENGRVIVDMTSKTAGDSQIIASVVNAKNVTSKANTSATFIADSSTMKFTVTADDKADVVADGKASHSVLVTVTDANNNPIADQVVGVKADNGATLVKVDKTDAAGKLAVTVTNTKAGDSVVTVTVNELAAQSVTVAFIADSSTVQFVDSDINVTMDNALANGEATNSVTVLVKDEHGNPVPNYEVAFSAAEGAKVANKVASTNSDGIATMTITSTIAGSYDISASITNKSGQTSSGKKPVTFVSDSSTMKFTVTADDKAGVVADGKASHSVLVTVTDANNNPIADQVVGVKADNGATLVKVDKTDAAGQLTVTVTNTKAGDSVVTVTVNELAEQSVTVAFIADSSTVQFVDSDMNVTMDNALANGEATNSVTVLVKDEHGNPVPNYEVAFSAAEGAKVANKVASTNSDGIATMTITSTIAGSYDISASITNKSGQTSSGKKPVTFVSDSSTMKFTVTADDKADVVADGKASHSVLVTVTDANNNPIADQVVGVKADNGATLVKVDKTDAAGQLTVTVTNTKAGDSVVTVTVNELAAQSVTVAFIADSSTVQFVDSDMNVTADNALATGEATNSVTVLVKDEHGNPVPNYEVAFSAAEGAKVANKVASTNSDGIATMTITSTIAGSYDISASITNKSGQTSSGKKPVTFIADNSTMKFTVTADDKAGVVADGKASHSVLVTVTDANNNPIADQVVGVKADNGATLVKVDKTDAAGKLTVTVTNIKAGDSVVTVTVNELAAQSVTVDFIADSSTGKITNSALTVLTAKDTKLANGEDSHRVQVLVEDAYGNVIADQKVTFEADNGAKIEADATTDKNGLVVVTMTSETAGVSNIVATITNAKNQTSDAKATAEFIANKGTATIDKSSITVENDNALADDKDELTVKVAVKDAKGNPLVGQTVLFGATGDLRIPLSEKTDEKGIATVVLTSTKAGEFTITATVENNNGKVSADKVVTFIPDNKNMVVTVVANSSESVIADGKATHSLIVTVTDTNKNAIAGQVVSVTASNSAQVGEVGKTNVKGQVTVTVTNTKAGESTVKATADGASGTDTITFIADKSTGILTEGALTVLTAKETKLANGSDKHQVQVTVKDAYGNAITGQKVTFTADNGAKIEADATTDENGSATVTMTSETAGVTNIVATITNAKNQTSDAKATAEFIANSGTATIDESSITVENDKALANGKDELTVKVSVKDAKGNPLVGQTVLFGANGGLMIPAAEKTDENGIATVVLTSKKADVFKITATVVNNNGAVFADKNVTFIADKSTGTLNGDGALVVLTKGDTKLANGEDKHQVQVTVKDANGNGVVNQKVLFTADNGASIDLDATTDKDGQAVVNMTSKTAGVSKITASITNDNGVTSKAEATATFTADKSTGTLNGDGALVVLTKDVTKLANGADKHQVQVTVKDANGNGVIGQKVLFTADNGATIEPEATTIENGIAVVTLSSVTAGVSKITASITNDKGVTSKADATATFTADKSTGTLNGDGALVVLTKDVTKRANGVDKHQVQVTVKDAKGNGVIGQKVLFTADNGATIEPEATTIENGIAVVTLSSVTAGVSKITASITNDKGVTSKADATATFTADKDTGTLNGDGALVVLTKDETKRANGADKHQVQVTVKDANGNGVIGQKVTFTADNGATIEPEATTIENGIAVVTLSSVTAGVSKITASITNDKGVTSKADATATFTADKDTGTLNGDGALVVLTKDETKRANGADKHQVQVTVKDANGNGVIGQKVTFTADNGATIEPEATTIENGIAVVTLSSVTAGVSKITASITNDKGVTSKADATATFTADKDTGTLNGDGALVVLTKDETKRANGSDKHQVQVTVKDANGNGVIGQKVLFTADNGATIEPEATTIENGIAVVTLSSVTAGVSKITASITNDNGVTSKADATATFTADKGTGTLNGDSALVVLTKESKKLANGDDKHQVQVTVKDAKGNGVVGQKVTFTADNGASIEPEATTNENGIAIVSMSSVTAGVSKITASITNDNGVTSKADATATFTADSGTATVDESKIKIDNDSAPADGISKITVEVSVTDANGNPLVGQTVSFSSKDGLTIPAPATATTGENGIATLELTSTKAGIFQITASVVNNSGTVSANKDVTFIADNKNIIVKVVANNSSDVIADGKATHSLTATVTDKNGNAIRNQAVSVTASNGASVSKVGDTDLKGQVTFTVTNTKAGKSTVKATSNSVSGETNITFIADEGTAKFTDSDFTVVVDNALANGKATNSVTVLVKDEQGNPVPNHVVSFSGEEGATVANNTATTGSDGIATMTITSTTAKSYSVMASITNKSNQTSSKSKTVTFIADEGTAKFTDSDFTVVVDNALANGKATNSVTVLVKDEQGNPVPNHVVSFSGEEGATVANNTATTGSDGIATMTITSTTAKSYSVMASITNKSNQTSSKSKTVTFIADEGTAKFTDSDFTVVVDNALANGKATNSVTVLVKDEQGNPVPNHVVSFSAGEGATVASSTATTGSDGIATMTITSMKAGSYSVTASITNKSNQTSSKSKTVTFIADEGTAKFTDSDFTVVVDNALANGKATNSVTVLVKDEQGNPVPNHVVSFSAGEGATVASSTATTGSDGIATMTITSMKAGSYSVTASITNKSNQISSKSKIVTFVADSGTATVDESKIKIDNDSAPADGISKITVEVSVTDANGNPLAGQTVSFSSKDGLTIPATATTGENGIATLELTSTKAGVFQITASVVNNSGTVSANKDVTFTADNKNIIVKVVANNSNDVIADGKATHSLTATVTDKNGNAIRNQAVSVTASNGASVSKVGDTDLNGQVTFTVTNIKAGESTVKATSNSVSGEAKITFIADEGTAKFTDSDFTVTVDKALANGKATNSVTVLVKDEQGNPVPNHVVSFSAGEGATVAGSMATTGSDGIATMTITSTKAGSYSVTASITNKSNQTSSKSKTVTFIADEGTAKFTDSDFTVTVDKALANGKATNSVTVLVKDEQGNPVPNYVVSFSAGEGATVASSTATTGSDGIATMTITSMKAGSYSVTASITNKSNQISSKSKTVTFVADSGTATVDESKIKIDNDSAPADGISKITVEVSVTDANGNPLVGQTVSFSSKDGLTIPATATTGENGIATLELTSTKAGVFQITASVVNNSGTVSANKDVTFTADNKNIIVKVVANNSNDVIADGKATHSLTATVTDKNGNAIRNQAVSVTASNGASVSKVGDTDLNGQVTFTVTNIKAGESTVKATSNSVSGETNITFIADKGTGTLNGDSALVVLTKGDTKLANGVEKHQVQVTVKDANGNGVIGQKVLFTADNGASIEPEATTIENGIAIVTLSSVTAGVSKITASITNDNGVTSKADATATFIADKETMVFTVKADEQNGVIADGKAKHSVVVTVTDKNGNAIAGQAVGVTATNSAKLDKASYATAENGQVTVTLTNTKAGNSDVKVTVAELAAQTKTVKFIADNATMVFTVKADEQNGVIADGNAKHSVVVTVTDKNGNAIAGQTVGVTASNSAKLDKASYATAANGQVTVTLTNTKAGNSDVKVTVAELAAQTKTVKFIADNATMVFTVKADEQNGVIADGKAKHSVVVTVTDKNGNAIAGQAVGVTATNSAKLDKASYATAANGQVTVTLTNTKAGNSDVKVTVAELAAQTKTVKFIADNATMVFTVKADEQNGVIADGKAKHSVVVTVTDKNGNAIAGQAVGVTATNSAKLDKASYATAENGQVTVTLTNTKAGNSDVKVTVAELAAQTKTVKFIADNATMVFTVKADEQNGVIADGKAKHSVVVTVTDKNGNAIAGQAVGVTATNSAKLDKASYATAANGQVTVTLTNTKAANSVVKVTVAELAAQTKTVKFIADNATMAFTVEAVKQEGDIIADGKAKHSVVVTVTDANSNVFAGQAVSVTATNGAKLDKTSYQTGTDGKVTIGLTSTTAGNSEVAVTVGSLTAKKVTVKFITDTPEVNTTKSSVALSTARIVNNGATSSTTGGSSTVTVTLQDTSGNAISGIADSIMLTSDKAGLNMPTNKNDTANRLVFKETGTNTGIYTAAIKTAAVDNKSALGAHKLTLSFNNGITYTKQLTFTVYTYQLVMNYPSREIGPGMIYEYKVDAIDSDTGTVNTSIVPGTYTWSSSNASVVSVNSMGWVKGEKQSDNQITVKATPSNAKFNGISLGVATGLVSVTALDSSPIYGVTSKSDPSPDYLIAPPDYQLLARTGAIVDAIGETGGTLGDKKYITQTDKVTKIEVLICTYTVRTGLRKYEDVPAVGQLIFHYNSSSPIGKIEIGRGDCKDKKVVETFTIPEKQQFVGYRAWTTGLMKVYNSVETRYIAGVQLYRAKK
ncbi:Ig-like domain-containing protein [Orbus sturtevantii]|uniref:Ig-like domain-containing protein n=1 Tax=Orbus sturtevantii TaxID=3074109 RepID=UPI00370D10A1